MARTAIRCSVGVVKLIGVGVAALALSLGWVQASAKAQDAPTYEMWDFGVVPRPSVMQVLLGSPAVQEELKITEAQKKEQDAIAERRVRKMQQARAEIKDRAKFREARDAIFEEAAAAERAILTPAQRERLDQIQLQAQGPLAFSLGGDDPGSSSADRSRFVGPPVPQRLRMSADQVKRARAIAQEADVQISKAASVRLPWDSKDRPSAEDIRQLVAGAEFRAAKQKALRDARAAWDAAIARIEGVWQRFCPRWAIRPRAHCPSTTSGKRLRPFAFGRRLRTRFVFRKALVRHRRTPEDAENSGVATDAGDHCMPSRSSSSSRSYVECELVFTFVTPGMTAIGPVCLESLPYPLHARRLC